MANLRANNLTGTGGRNAIDGSVFFDGGSSLTVADNSGYEFGTGDFTIECWINASDLTHERHLPIIQKGNSATNNLYDWRLYFNNHGSGSSLLYFDIACSGTSISANSTGVFVEDAWIHVAVTRQSGAFKVFFNGILEDTDSTTANAIDDDYTEIKIGFNDLGSAGDSYLKGYISNLRIIKGTALYTASFTPPTEKLTAVDGTVLLCCQDSDDPTQEATGKTVTAYGGLVEGDDTELITNSGFTSDISGWTASGIQWSHSSGALMHFGNGDTQRNIFQDVTTVIGNRYVLRIEASSAEADTAYWQVVGDSDIAGNNFIADNNNAAPLEYVFYFTADSTTTKIRFYSYDSSNSSNVRSYWYKASLKLAPQGEAPKVLPSVGVDEGVTFEGDTKVNTQGYMYFPTGDTSQRGRGRAVFFSGNSTASPAAASLNNTIDYIQIQSQGNAIDFGDMTHKYRRNAGGNASSSTRGMSVGGFRPSGSPSRTDTMMYITFATTGDATDFGNLSQAGSDHMGVSNETRGVFLGSIDASGNWLNIIDYVTIASTGNAADFGDITIEAYSTGSGCSSPTRGVVGGGFNNTPATTTNKDYITYITIATTGNTSDFGNLTVARRGAMAASSAVRGVWAGGSSSPTEVNNIDYITIASTGDATDFGDLTPLNSGGGGSSNGTRGVFGGGYGTSPHPKVNVINRVEIATTGDAQDFGDLTLARANSASASDSHGGLS